MSEIHESDLDRAFAALTRELTTRSSGPGAPAAVATVRKRRRRRVGVVAFVAAAVVAGFAAPSFTGGTHAGPAGSSHALPTSAPLSASSLTEATRGWTDGLQELTEANSAPLDDLSVPCLDGPDFPQTQAERSGHRMFVTDGGAMVNAGFNDYSNDPAIPDQWTSAMSALMARCGAHLTESTYGDVTLAHGAAAGTPDQDVIELWLAQVGDRVATLIVMGPATVAPADAAQAVTRVFLAAVQEESSYETTSQPLDAPHPEKLTETPARAFADISLEQIQGATGTWSEDWTNESSPQLTTLPCISGSWPAENRFDGSARIGDRGTLTFAVTNEPVHAIDTILTSLSTCDAAQWTVHRIDHTPYDTGWASYEGGSVFLAVDDHTVASLRVSGLEVPNGAVARQMIGLLKDALAHPTSEFGTS